MHGQRVSHSLLKFSIIFSSVRKNHLPKMYVHYFTTENTTELEMFIPIIKDNVIQTRSSYQKHLTPVGLNNEHIVSIFFNQTNLLKIHILLSVFKHWQDWFDKLYFIYLMFNLL